MGIWGVSPILVCTIVLCDGSELGWDCGVMEEGGGTYAQGLADSMYAHACRHLERGCRDATPVSIWGLCTGESGFQ